VRLAACLLAGAAALALPAWPTAAQPISQRDSFPIGSATSLVCSAQSSSLDRAFADMFDRGYQVVCRDAAAPIANLYALRLRGGDPAARLAAVRRDKADCGAAASADLPGLGQVTRIDCTLRGADVAYRVYLRRQGGTLYAAEGLAGYDSALQLGLRTLIADRPVDGVVAVATTGAGDPAAFARAQAGTLDPRRALNEAYRRNNAGAYAEAGEFFGTLIGAEEQATRAEATVNQALQSSNLGRYAEAEALFARAAALGGADPVLRRRLRNYVALHLLNQGELSAALAELDRPLDTSAVAPDPQAPQIDAELAERLNTEAPGRGAIDRATALLTPAEKIQILDGQRLQLRGTVLRLQGQRDAAVPLLTQAFEELGTVRGGVVASTIWMRAQIQGELAAIAEAQGNGAEAERLHRAAIALLEVDYPGSDALLSAKARLASFYARTGRSAEARSLYKALVATHVESGTGSTVIRRLLDPYLGLLTGAEAGPDAAADLFLASQVALRPGVAQTLTLLARELSADSDEEARLFRQSVALTRDVERTRVAIARLQAAPAADPAELAQLRGQLASFEQAQVATQARLTQFPRFRAISPAALPLPDLQRQLRADEAYYKLIVLDRSAYAVLVTPAGARAFKVEAAPALLEEWVNTLRATITLVENGENVTYPFDVETAHLLYRSLFAPVATELAGVRHLVFEPDGALLRLPVNLLVETQAGVNAYLARTAREGGDAFDFTGLPWFGRDRQISTAVSPVAFRDVRAAPASRAANQYLGFGQNAPVAAATTASLNVRGGSDGECGWAIAAWNRPISADELNTARQALAGRGGSDVVTGQAFSDTAILQRTDLDQYRVMHFATHGLVSPPRPDCPARPSLLTSFGGPESDGLLSFGEIFDLRLDADLIILSACDTAGQAGLAATREVGLTTGGDVALDGLVRAFVGAGGRLVVASHWPVPDEYDATERLVSGLFTAPAGTGTAAALAAAQRQLMDVPATSHPYYWSGFAVIGDGTTPVIRPTPLRSASRD
jgi:CHAT domain-containing protein